MDKQDLMAFFITGFKNGVNDFETKFIRKAVLESDVYKNEDGVCSVSKTDLTKTIASLMAYGVVCPKDSASSVHETEKFSTRFKDVAPKELDAFIAAQSPYYKNIGEKLFEAYLTAKENDSYFSTVRKMHDQKNLDNPVAGTYIPETNYSEKKETPRVADDVNPELVSYFHSQKNGGKE